MMRRGRDLQRASPRDPAIDERRLRRAREKIIEWAREDGRHFFWREHGADPFAVLVAELLLTRTRAESVEPVAQKLLARFPDAVALAGADLEEVERVLFPLGLHRKRARHLVACAKRLVHGFGGSVPRRIDEMLTLPYVGPYAAHAVACVAFDAVEPVLDVNVARVYRRVFSLPPPPARLSAAADLWAFAARLVPLRRAREFNWALLDLGGTICTARSPKCSACPVSRMCDAHRHGICGCGNGKRR